MKLLRPMICLLLLPVLTAGCIKEDMDDCENVSIGFRYEADGDTDVLLQYMDQIDLYVFDTDGQLVRKTGYGQSDLKGDGQTMPFRLVPGKYTLVAVGNAYSRTTVTEGDGKLEHFFVQHPAWETTGEVEGHDHNYMGRKEIEVPSDGKRLHETVQLYSSHIDVSVEVHGLPAPGSNTRAGESAYSLCFENANARIDFNNQVDREQTETCRPPLYYDSSTGAYRTNDLVLFRMDSNGTLDAGLCRHCLRLTDADGVTRATFDLHDYLTRYSDKIDVTLQEAQLPISITFTPVGVTIELPSWGIEDINPGWDR